MDMLRNAINFIAGDKDETTARARDSYLEAESAYGDFVNTKNENAQEFANALKKNLDEAGISYEGVGLADLYGDGKAKWGLKLRNGKWIDLEDAPFAKRALSYYVNRPIEGAFDIASIALTGGAAGAALKGAKTASKLARATRLAKEAGTVGAFAGTGRMADSLSKGQSLEDSALNAIETGALASVGTAVLGAGLPAIGNVLKKINLPSGAGSIAKKGVEKGKALMPDNMNIKNALKHIDELGNEIAKKHGGKAEAIVNNDLKALMETDINIKEALKIKKMSPSERLKYADDELSKAVMADPNLFSNMRAEVKINPDLNKAIADTISKEHAQFIETTGKSWDRVADTKSIYKGFRDETKQAYKQAEEKLLKEYKNKTVKLDTEDIDALADTFKNINSDNWLNSTHLKQYLNIKSGAQNAEKAGIQSIKASDDLLDDEALALLKDIDSPNEIGIKELLNIKKDINKRYYDLKGIDNKDLVTVDNFNNVKKAKAFIDNKLNELLESLPQSKSKEAFKEANKNYSKYADIEHNELGRAFNAPTTKNSTIENMITGVEQKDPQALTGEAHGFTKLKNVLLEKGKLEEVDRLEVNHLNSLIEKSVKKTNNLDYVNLKEVIDKINPKNFRKDGVASKKYEALKVSFDKHKGVLDSIDILGRIGIASEKAGLTTTPASWLQMVLFRKMIDRVRPLFPNFINGHLHSMVWHTKKGILASQGIDKSSMYFKQASAALDKAMKMKNQVVDSEIAKSMLGMLRDKKTSLEEKKKMLKAFANIIKIYPGLKTAIKRLSAKPLASELLSTIQEEN